MRNSERRIIQGAIVSGSVPDANNWKDIATHSND